MVVFERACRPCCAACPAARSSSPTHRAIYTEAVLRLAGIRQAFDAVYSIEQLRFRPKPAVSGFLRILRRERRREGCIMVEDSLANPRHRQTARHQDGVGERRFAPLDTST